MKVLIIGAGLIGVTAAYALRGRGHEVTVLERRSGVGEETSFANGALLHPSMPEPWNSPGCWRVLLRSLGRNDAALQLRMRHVPAMLPWGARFLRNSRPAIFERNALHNLRLARYSLKAMHTLRAETGIEYGRETRGSLRIFRDVTALETAVAWVTRRRSEGLRFIALSAAEAVELEPALAPIAGQMAGALHYQDDEVGDAYRFCVALSECARKRGVTFFFDTDVSALELQSDHVIAARTSRGRFSADRYLVAAASYSPTLLGPIGIGLPLQPAKGYSVTVIPQSGWRTPRIPVIDDQLHAAITPLSEAIRVSGTAEFTGYNRDLHPERIRNLVRLLLAVYPDATFDERNVRPWCGLRPMSVDGVPIIGPTRIANLLVSTGHGPLGWTMAAGSAQLLADLLEGSRAAIDASPYDPRRSWSTRPQRR